MKVGLVLAAIFGGFGYPIFFGSKGECGFSAAQESTLVIASIISTQSARDITCYHQRNQRL